MTGTKAYLVIGNTTRNVAAMRVAHFDPSKFIEPQLREFAGREGFDLENPGVACVELAGAIGALTNLNGAVWE